MTALNVRVPAVLLAAAASILLISFLCASQAHALRITSFDGEVVNRDSGGNAVAATQAASHPDEASATFALEETTRFSDGISPAGVYSFPTASVKTVAVDLPPGLVGNPRALPRCTEKEFTSINGLGLPACPHETQVGEVLIRATNFSGYDINAGWSWHPVALYNMEPPPGVPGAFAFAVASVPIHLRAEVRSGSDYGLTLTVPNINQALPLIGTRVTMWGVPSDPRHDARRGICTYTGGIDPITMQPCTVSTARTAFLTNPTSCVGPVTTTARMDSWQEPGAFRTASFLSHKPAPDERELIGVENCERVPFDAKLDAQPTEPAAGKPSGYNFDITIPQDLNPDGLGQGHLKKATVRLPQGVAVSPSASAGLEACSPAQISLDTINDPTCPNGSKIGTVRIDTPLLEDPMDGSIYLAQQTENPFRSLLALYIVARGPGVVLKLPGKVEPDPVTGQLTATFDDNPQLPFSRLHLEFTGGPRASLSNPSTCGNYTTVTQLESWSGKTVTSNSSFTINQGCTPRGFAPKFAAGMRQAAAGTSSPLDVQISREDSDALLSRVTVDTPPGVTGMIANADLCPEALANAGTCGASSQVGTVQTGAGPGPAPFFLPGKVFITGPYKGAPFGLSIVVPAKAGPFDLGTVVVRAAINVDRRDTSLSVVADPMPTILQGIPLQVRKISISMDKPGFMVAPTSCRASSVDGQITSPDGLSAAVRSRFQVGSCGALPYRPRLTFRIGDSRHVAAESTTPLAVTLNMPRGTQANNRSVEVTLPKNVNSRLAALRGACSVENARARRCASEAVVGTAVAVTPLLRDPFSGPVYIVRTVGNRLPDLWVALRGRGAGAGVEIDLIGRVRVGRDLRLRTTFGEIPDVPVSMFRLNFVSGRQAPIGLVRGICSRSVQKGMVSDLKMRGQNGRLVAGKQRMTIVGCRATRRAAARRGATRRGSSRRG